MICEARRMWSHLYILPGEPIPRPSLLAPSPPWGRGLARLRRVKVIGKPATLHPLTFILSPPEGERRMFFAENRCYEVGICRRCDRPATKYTSAPTTGSNVTTTSQMYLVCRVGNWP